MKKLLYILLIFSCSIYGQHQTMLLASQQQFANEGGVSGMVYNPYNLVLSPEDMSNTPTWWFGNIGTFEYDSYLSPFGDLTSDRMNNWSATDGYVRQTVTTSPNADYTFSWYTKIVTKTEMSYRVETGSGVELVPTTSYTSELATDEWRLITKTFNSGINTSVRLKPFENTPSTVGTFELWGVQAYKTIYDNFPTVSGDAVSRMNCGAQGVVTATDGDINWGDNSGTASDEGVLWKMANTGGGNGPAAGAWDLTNLTALGYPIADMESLFDGEKYGPTTKFTYELLDGDYTINLFFGESYVSAAGLRVFDIVVNGVTIESNFDPYVFCGNADYVAKIYSFNHTVSSLTHLVIDLIASSDNSAIKGIEIVVQ